MGRQLEVNVINFPLCAVQHVCQQESRQGMVHHTIWAQDC